MTTQNRLLGLAFAILLLCGCEDKPDQVVQGYAPVYLPKEQTYLVSRQSAQLTKRPGKIYAWSGKLFQVDINTGIHIIDNSNPAQPVKEAFISVPGCSEIAIRNGYLYTNNMNDLVVLNLGANATVSQRLPNAFPQAELSIPPVANTAFECPDPEKGIVVGWQLKTLTNPKCRR